MPHRDGHRPEPSKGRKRAIKRSRWQAEQARERYKAERASQRRDRAA